MVGSRFFTVGNRDYRLARTRGYNKLCGVRVRDVGTNSVSVHITDGRYINIYRWVCIYGLVYTHPFPSFTHWESLQAHKIVVSPLTCHGLHYPK